MPCGLVGVFLFYLFYQFGLFWIGKVRSTALRIVLLVVVVEVAMLLLFMSVGAGWEYLGRWPALCGPLGLVLGLLWGERLPKIFHPRQT